MDLNRPPLIFCPGLVGYDIADQISKEFGWNFVTSKDKINSSFATELCRTFISRRPIVGVCSSGILIRILAPLINNKSYEPAVVCIAPDGSNVIPLIGGHQQGANQLARVISDRLNSNLVMTTASDVILGCSLDEPPDEWRLHNPEDVKQVAVSILAGKDTLISGSHKWLRPLLKWQNVNQESAHSEEEISVHVEGVPALRYSKQILALGVGCIRGCSSNLLLELVEQSLSEANLSKFAIEGIYSIDLKADETAIYELAQTLGVPAKFYPPEVLDSYTPQVSVPSKIVYKETGTHSVSEAAALARAGSEGQILIPKKVHQGATCAVARIGTANANKALHRGTLMIVGIGPGKADLYTLETNRMLGMADDIVGYKKYIDLLGSISNGKNIYEFELGQERERCQFALEQAAKGRKIALVSSGDAGIYAMASLIFELLAMKPDQSLLSDAARRVEIICSPGISAMQLASSRAGAILGHDFCTISLSDLMTPRDIILKRIRSAAIGDFVISFYNPVSQKRRTLFGEAKKILLNHRLPDTPVLIARNLGRTGEKIIEVSLSKLDPEQVDMLTVVIVGNSQTRSFQVGDRKAGVGGRFVFTPRGYTIQSGVR